MTIVPTEDDDGDLTVAFSEVQYEEARCIPSFLTYSAYISYSLQELTELYLQIWSIGTK